MIRKLLLIIICIGIAFPVFAQTDIPEFPIERRANINIPPEIKDRTEQFFNTILEGRVESAYRQFLKNSPLAEKESDIANLITETRKSFELYGKALEFEAVEAEYVTPSYIRLKYLGLNEDYPTRWMFTFYKSPSKGWIVTQVKFDDLAQFYFSDQ
ncbi:MAG: hypothetical protein ACLFQX_05585 [Candidatus Kapaibacterium sp.]